MAPYTHRLYEAVAKSGTVDLHILACTGLEPQRQWQLPADTAYHLTTLSGLSYHRSYTSHVYFNPGVVWEIMRLRPSLIMLDGFSPTMLFAAKTAYLLGIPVSVITDGTPETDPGAHSAAHRLARRSIIPHAAQGIGASEASLHLLQSYGLAPELGVIVPIPVAWDAPGTYRSFGARTYDVLFSGSIDDDRKGALFFADVLEACKDQGRSLRVRVVGDGPLRGALERRLEKAGIQARFDGYLQQSELAEAYGSARLLLFPSRGDPWGLVANEALLCGTPVIASPHATSSHELIGRFSAGMVVPLEVAVWQQAVESLLSSPERWAALQSRHAEACRWFSCERSAAILAGAISRTISEKGIL
jgi:glycosyltransferase involved in cell wall biosynthesis